MFRLLPGTVWLPMAVYVTFSPFAKPSPPTVTSLFVRAVPSYSFSSEADVRTTVLGVIVSLPSAVLTVNWFVTSTPLRFTAAVPVTLTSLLSATFVPVAFAVRPVTVKVTSSISNVRALKPLTDFSVPSYLNSPLFASTVISNLSLRSVIVSVPSTVLML